ncbi:hypothetical protein CDAR_613041 [Caerostris darwini]|uniref:Uncharacterized protein n=1 Tax=Caerostris darwini TaxID=1538125 RepID=A0AAV4UEW6_9ARAC|nr:hypothetical protein CDAR_613041 [Caerostris darwini]
MIRADDDVKETIQPSGEQFNNQIAIKLSGNYLKRYFPSLREEHVLLSFLILREINPATLKPKSKAVIKGLLVITTPTEIEESLKETPRDPPLSMLPI